MATYRLAAIIRNPSDELLITKQSPPPPLIGEEYKNYVDSELHDIPSVTLSPLLVDSKLDWVIKGAEACIDQIDLRGFDVSSAIDQVVLQVGFDKSISFEWVFLKYSAEPDFGPVLHIHTVFILGRLKYEVADLPERSQWMSIPNVKSLLANVKPRYIRVGPLVADGLSAELALSTKFTLPPMLQFQEYPSGVVVVPMESRTQKPFSTTNLVVIAPDTIESDIMDPHFVAQGDAIILDPGCHHKMHSKLEEIVAALPRKLLVLVTHHHYDHVEGLSVIQKCNPEATLLAHENTMKRIGSWSLGYTPLSGGEVIKVSDQKLEVIFAPGHTDGHIALLHSGTHSLIVGDHCVGQGSSVLDITSGGNMKDYFETTYKFLDLAPHALISMHGRINVWPLRMLCGYLKHRRDRESTILAAIESGAETLYDIVSKSYADVDPSLWVPASSNVRLHVDHLASQNKLPKGFSMENYQSSQDMFVFKMGTNKFKM
ncbi:uncharacterized protein LOC18432182 isoform X2 [Amborella trichopoda]|uniref:Metallo-beta-lactamase domain-containing protein n=1 Tax=Amborella trichopoda TaxID=13333 RepID=W1PAI4_AMBTC|nr:uncharacterized protein LOC18432182 isoform X2 [Amborella trichopoda]ERN04030.1 hypothetical protein AMTR_s00079p00177100 [Amborella trichopoda]|eukprot:XP_006842355.1 uncharacterized protein LOC18432182 isoform X2 [Amborella trichopoda]